MENEKLKSYYDLFHTLILDGTADKMFGGRPDTPKPKYTQLGEGYELRPIKLTADEQSNKYILDMKYSHLYHNGLKVSDSIFRIGGFGGKFKNGYCELIQYTRDTKRERGFSSGNFVIVNHLGEIVLKSEEFSGTHPRHEGGNVGFVEDMYYDLRTGEPFMVKSSSVINGKNFIIVEHKYDWYGKELNIPTGVYKIDKETCQFEKIDEIKK